MSDPARRQARLPGRCKGILGLNIRALSPADRDWVKRHVAEHWGAEIAWPTARFIYPAELPGFVAEMDGKMAGLVTFHIAGDACEIVTLDSLRETRASARR